MADITNQQLMDGLTELIAGLAEVMVTKEEAKAFATKEDLKAFITKDDLKQELKRFATKDDIQQLEVRLNRKLDNHKQANIHHHLLTQSQIGEINRKFNRLHEGLSQAAQSIQ